MALARGALSSGVRPRHAMKTNASFDRRMSAVEEELRPFRSKQWRELVDLPQVSSRDVQGFSRVAKLSVHRELVPPDSVRIVGQLYEQALGGISARITVLGFDAKPGGVIRELEDRELWDYM